MLGAGQSLMGTGNLGSIAGNGPCQKLPVYTPMQVAGLVALTPISPACRASLVSLGKGDRAVLGQDWEGVFSRLSALFSFGTHLLC